MKEEDYENLSQADKDAYLEVCATMAALILDAKERGEDNGPAIMEHMAQVCAELSPELRALLIQDIKSERIESALNTPVIEIDAPAKPKDDKAK